MFEEIVGLGVFANGKFWVGREGNVYLMWWIGQSWWGQFDSVGAQSITYEYIDKFS